MQSRDPRFDGWFFVAVSSYGHRLPAELPGRARRAASTCASTPPPRPPRRPATAPVCAAGRTPRPARRSGTCRWTWPGAPCASSPTAWWTARAWTAWRGAWPTVRASSVACCWRELGAGPLSLARAQRAQTAQAAHRDYRPAVRRRGVRRRLCQSAPVQRHGALKCSRARRRELRRAAPARRRRGAARRGGGPPRRDRAAACRCVSPFDAAGSAASFRASAPCPVWRRPARTGCGAPCRCRTAPAWWSFGRPRGRPGAAPASRGGVHVAALLRLTDLRDLAAAVSRCRALLRPGR